MAPFRLMFAVAAVAALVGGAVAALTVTLVREEGGGESRGAVLDLSTEFGFLDGMWCSPHHRFCIPEYDAQSEARVLHTVSTNAHSRQLGCAVDWVPDRDLSGFGPTFSDEPGAFVAQCDGSLWLRDGTRLFGPAPRDLDEFPAQFEQREVEIDGDEMQFEVLVVDTRELICGRTSDGERAEECEFAPAFE